MNLNRNVPKVLEKGTEKMMGLIENPEDMFKRAAVVLVQIKTICQRMS